MVSEVQQNTQNLIHTNINIHLIIDKEAHTLGMPCHQMAYRRKKNLNEDLTPYTNNLLKTDGRPQCKMPAIHRESHKRKKKKQKT